MKESVRIDISSSNKTHVIGKSPMKCAKMLVEHRNILLICPRTFSGAYMAGVAEEISLTPKLPRSSDISYI